MAYTDAQRLTIRGFRAIGWYIASTCTLTDGSVRVTLKNPHTDRAWVVVVMPDGTHTRMLLERR